VDHFRPVGAGWTGSAPAASLISAITSALPRGLESSRLGTLEIAAFEARLDSVTRLVDRVRILRPRLGKWFLTSSAKSAAALREWLAADQNEQGIIVSHLSLGLAVPQVPGAAARDIIAKGCGLDFRPQVFSISTRCPAGDGCVGVGRPSPEAAEIALVVFRGPSRASLRVGIPVRGSSRSASTLWPPRGSSFLSSRERHPWEPRVAPGAAPASRCGSERTDRHRSWLDWRLFLPPPV
jgi:sarcosine oxidase gamma subunit